MTIKELYEKSLNKHCEDMELCMLEEEYTGYSYLVQANAVFKDNYVMICKECNYED